jgi:hypothetical protein
VATVAKDMMVMGNDVDINGILIYEVTAAAYLRKVEVAHKRDFVKKHA